MPHRSNRPLISCLHHQVTTLRKIDPKWELLAGDGAIRKLKYRLQPSAYGKKSKRQRRTTTPTTRSQTRKLYQTSDWDDAQKNYEESGEVERRGKGAER
ncbi:MAG: hypothetical protein M1824_001807 [Vezdaea acicularis]|nr:MAG: hypothetical protein M1824_001807 [Vezdaea acicularis]